MSTEIAVIDASYNHAVGVTLDMNTVSEETRNMLRGARAKNTHATYARAAKQYAAYCAARGAPTQNPPSRIIADYLSHQAARGLSPASIGVHLAAIAHAHRHSGSPFDTSIFEGVMDGIRRQYARAPKQSKPAVLETIEEAVGSLGDSLKDRRDRALLLLGFHAARRRSELAGLDVGSAGPDAAGFIEFTDDGVVITLLRSKTNQRRTEERYAVPSDAAPDLIPALRAWLDAAGIVDGPLFRAVTKGAAARVGARMSGAAVSDVIKNRLGEGFTGHALRRGFITDAAAAGLTTLDIMRQSGHKSHDMVQTYVDKAELFRNNAASKLAERRNARRKP
jgi:integrase